VTRRFRSLWAPGLRWQDLRGGGKEGRREGGRKGGSGGGSDGGTELKEWVTMLHIDR